MPILGFRAPSVRCPRPMVHDKVLALPRGVAFDGYDNAGRLPLDVARIFLEETIVPVASWRRPLLRTKGNCEHFCEWCARGQQRSGEPLHSRVCRF